jgi:hypothetical protein
MEKNKLIELSRICSNNSILVANKTGIYRLFCPFKVSCIRAVGLYSIGQEITVIQVKMDKQFKLVYIIQDKGYYHHYFMILSIPTCSHTSFN